MECHNSTELEGKVALVTGTGRGIGRAVVGRLGAGGARVVVNDLNEETARTVAAELAEEGIEAVAISGDVTSSENVTNIINTTIETLGTVHILVNNAGILRPTPFADIEEDEWDLVIKGNLKATYLCSRAVLPVMKEQGWGRIVNFSSTAGKNVSTVGGPHYTAAKAGILGLTRHLAKEVAVHGITVNSVCPGLIDTEMVRSVIDEDRAKSFAASFPVSRLGEPSEVAELVAFLASDRTAYITGASLDINGGALMV